MEKSLSNKDIDQFQINAMDISDAVTVKSSRLKSVVWNDFDRIKKGDTFIAVCRHCKKILNGSSTSGTSHLRNHLIRCKRRSNHGIPQVLAVREKKRKGTLAIASYSFDQEQNKDEVLNLVNIKFEGEQMKDNPISTANVIFDQRRSQFDLARMIILHGYPLTMVDHIGFKVFVKNLQPLFELVTVKRVEADCLEIYSKEKQKVYEVLDNFSGKISLSVDTWATCDDAEFLCLTAHFVDENWELRKKILNFCLVDPSHTEDMSSKSIMDCMKDWDIDRKLFSMTFDSSTNDNIRFTIREWLSQNRFLFCNGQLFDVHCAANIIDLMAQDALEALTDVTNKIRESIRYVKSSQSAQEKLNEMAQQVNVESKKSLCLDTPLRWNTTYIMLETALEYKGAFSLLKESDPFFKTCPSDIEWQQAIFVTNCLKIFVEVISTFARSKYSTANIYFSEICHVHGQLNEWCQIPDDFTSFLVLKMRRRFDDYWKRCSLILAVVTILDPRFKMKLVEYYFQQIFGNCATEHIADVFDCLHTLYNEHLLGSPLALLDQDLDCQVDDSSGCLSGSGNDSKDRLVGFDKYLHETTQNEGLKSDLDKYLEEPLFPRGVDFSILNWWKVHTPRYPILSTMARNILGIPMSKIAVESAFCTGGRVLDRDQSSLSPATVEALICSRDWIMSELES